MADCADYMGITGACGEKPIAEPTIGERIAAKVCSAYDAHPTLEIDVAAAINEVVEKAREEILGDDSPGTPLGIIGSGSVSNSAPLTGESGSCSERGSDHGEAHGRPSC